MTVHTHVERRNGGVLALPGIAMTVQAIDLVDARMHFMRIIDRLLRLVSLLAAQIDSAFTHIIPNQNKQDDGNKSNVYFISIERNRLGANNILPVVGKLFKVAVYLH